MRYGSQSALEVTSAMDEAKLWDLINDAWERMSLPQKRLWEMIRVEPKRWMQEPYGKHSGGFWVVGLVGQIAIWFNDHEDGFQCTAYERPGEITEYGSLQFGLEEILQHLLNELEAGGRTLPHSSAPLPGAFSQRR